MIWFCRKQHGESCEVAEVLNLVFGHIFVLELNNGIDLDYLWIANAKIYDDSVGEVIVLLVWIINVVLHTLLC